MEHTYTGNESAGTVATEAGARTDSRPIGAILAEKSKLTEAQIKEVLAHQGASGIRFGEAAIDLGFVTAEDVLIALSLQFNYPYLGKAQRSSNPELVSLNQSFGKQAESIRAIRSQIMMRTEHEGETRRAIAVVSPDSGDGKTFFTANLAVSMAQLGGRTLLIDGDMRGPRQHEVFGLANDAGLSGILSGRTEAKVIQQVPGLPALYLLPVGITPPNPLELVEQPAFGLLIRELLLRFDHILVDTPAAVFGSDAEVIASRCGAALLVARNNKSRVAALQELAENLGHTPTKIVGVVYNEY